ncbi:MAG: hypothetical protein LUH08_04390 [Ruminococcus sp.]|nr:hypothetical protein [Ruminococcus sp.]
MSKSERQNAILKIISENVVRDQEELLTKLSECGFNAAQATISRDIKDLSLIKVNDAKNGYHYDIPASLKEKGKSPLELLMEIFPQAVISVDFAINTVVIKCYTGMAQAVCAKLDNANFERVVGTIAGDDTIFVVLKSEQSAIELVNKLRHLLG